MGGGKEGLVTVHLIFPSLLFLHPSRLSHQFTPETVNSETFLSEGLQLLHLVVLSRRLATIFVRGRRASISPSLIIQASGVHLRYWVLDEHFSEFFFIVVLEFGQERGVL